MRVGCPPVNDTEFLVCEERTIKAPLSCPMTSKQAQQCRSLRLHVWKWPMINRLRAHGSLEASAPMVNRAVSAVPRVRGRQICEADIPAIATLLTRGFPRRTRVFWLRALEQLRRREPPPDLPKYGYLIESDGVPVGEVLLICSTMRANDTVTTRCNLSSWYVEPNFRTYATVLRAQALRHRDVTYSNISAKPAIRPIIESQGFSRYCDGTFLAAPALSELFKDARVKVFGAHRRPEVDFDPLDWELLVQHAMFGCISLWCVTSECAHPFVFRWHPVEAVIPCMQLIYCRDVADFVRFAGPIGRFLALRGSPFVRVDANGPIPGLIGRFFPNRAPKYFRGPQRPRLGDLAYTEYALWGL
jgi:hypothetical protein